MLCSFLGGLEERVCFSTVQLYKLYGDHEFIEGLHDAVVETGAAIKKAKFNEVQEKEFDSGAEWKTGKQLLDGFSAHAYVAVEDTL
ncbi:MAG: hypothetical protein WB676_22495, partial [Bryobacteraceae bacterium]